MALPLTEMESNILRVLREQGGLTLAEIANAIDLGVSDTALIVAKLVREDLITIRNLYEARDIDPGRERE